MKKRLDIETISNELKGASLFFQRPPVTPAESSPAQLPSSTPEPSDHEASDSKAERPSVAPPARPDSRTPVRRRLTRMPFEFYQDQLERLRAISLEEKLKGEKGSMSEMVREAVDHYLADRDSLPAE